jgi:hypothetical protein
MLPSPAGEGVCGAALQVGLTGCKEARENSLISDMEIYIHQPERVSVKRVGNFQEIALPEYLLSAKVGWVMMY